MLNVKTLTTPAHDKLAVPLVPDNVTVSTCATGVLVTFMVLSATTGFAMPPRVAEYI